MDWWIQLKNIGNETFNGTVTLEAKTDKGHSWNVLTYKIENLTSNEVYSNSTSYPSVDDGLYYFTVNIESNTLSNIALYQGSNMIANGSRVQTDTSIIYHSYTEFIAVVAIVVAIISALIAIAIGIKTKKR